MFNQWLKYLPKKVYLDRHTCLQNTAPATGLLCKLFCTLARPHLHTKLCLIKTHKHVDDVKP